MRHREVGVEGNETVTIKRVRAGGGPLRFPSMHLHSFLIAQDFCLCVDQKHGCYVESRRVARMLLLYQISMIFGFFQNKRNVFFSQVRSSSLYNSTVSLPTITAILHSCYRQYRKYKAKKRPFFRN